jgi:hypothetical protein
MLCDHLTVPDLCTLSATNRFVRFHLVPASRTWARIQAVPQPVRSLCTPDVGLTRALGAGLSWEQRVDLLARARVMAHPKNYPRVCIDDDLVYRFKYGVWVRGRADTFGLQKCRRTEHLLSHAWRHLSDIARVVLAKERDIHVRGAVSVYCTATRVYHRYESGFVRRRDGHTACVTLTDPRDPPLLPQPCYLPAAVAQQPQLADMILQAASSPSCCATHDAYTRAPPPLDYGGGDVNEIMIPFDSVECSLTGQLARGDLTGALFYDAARWRTHGTRARPLARVVKMFSQGRFNDDGTDAAACFDVHIAFDDDLPWSDYLGTWAVDRGPHGCGVVRRRDGSFLFGDYSGSLDHLARGEPLIRHGIGTARMGVQYDAEQKRFFFGFSGHDGRSLDGVMLDCHTLAVTWHGKFAERDTRLAMLRFTTPPIDTLWRPTTQRSSMPAVVVVRALHLAEVARTMIEQIASGNQLIGIIVVGLWRNSGTTAVTIEGLCSPRADWVHEAPPRRLSGHKRPRPAPGHHESPRVDTTAPQ